MKRCVVFICSLLMVVLVRADAGFLLQLGIDTSLVTHVPLDGGRFAIDEYTPFVALDGRQVIALLDDAVHWQEAIEADEAEGGRSIAAVYPVTRQHTIVVFSQEFGDGARNELAVYDWQGRLTDYLDMGYWRDMTMLSIDDDPESEADVRWNTALVAEGGGNFVIERTDHCCTWTDGNSLNPHVVGQRITRFHYQVDTAGHLHLSEITTHDTGHVFAQHYRLEEINQMNWLPLSDTTRLSRLNQLAANDAMQNEMNKELSDPDYASDDVYRIRLLIWQFFDEKPQEFFQWMYVHRDHDDNHLTPLLLGNLASGFTSLDMAERHARHIADPNVKHYIQQLLANVQQ